MDLNLAVMFGLVSTYECFYKLFALTNENNPENNT